MKVLLICEYLIGDKLKQGLLLLILYIKHTFYRLQHNKKLSKQ